MEFPDWVQVKEKALYCKSKRLGPGLLFRDVFMATNTMAQIFEQAISKDNRAPILVIWLLVFKQRERNFSQSKDDSFVERVAKNNS